MLNFLRELAGEKYDLIEEEPIKEGGFGQIYRIRDKKVKTEYILKKIKKEQNNSKKNFSSNKISFENEINFLKQVKGKNILQIIDYYENEKYYYIILEKMDGDLEDMLEQYENGMSSKLIRKIFLQINSGLQIMLKRDKCHRDLKLSNILYSYINDEKTDFVIKIGDFGLATDLKYTQYATNAGTEFFRAPEVEEKIPKYSNKCDLYSIGIILFYLKTGEYIFDGERKLDILNNKDQNIIKKETDDQLLNQLIKKLVVKNPHERLDWDDYFNDLFFKVNDEDIEENDECKIIYLKKDKKMKNDFNKISIGKNILSINRK